MYIATDITKLERERCKKVVAELKTQRSSGESNVTICNGVIVPRCPHPDSNSTVHKSAQTSKGSPGQSNQSSWCKCWCWWCGGTWCAIHWPILK